MFYIYNICDRTTTKSSVSSLTVTYFRKDLIHVFEATEGFPGGASGKESTCQCRRCKRYGFDPWVEKTPCSRKWQPTPVFFPGKILWI